MSKRQEIFNIDEKVVRDFIEINSKVWKSDSPADDKYIYVNLSMVRMQVAWVIPKLIYARGLADKYNAKVIAITWNENELLKEFFESFDIKQVSLNTLCDENKSELLKATAKTAGFQLFNGTGKGLQNLNVCGVKAGREIYEDILRTSDISTIGSTRNKVCTKKTLHIIWVLYALEKFIKKHKPLVLIDDDVAYHEGAMEKLFNKHGVELIIINNTQRRPITFNASGEIIREREYARGIIAGRLDEIDDNAISWTDKYMSEKFKGLNGREIDRVAYKDKKVFTREEISESLGLDTSKKNIVIMAHTFTDAIYNQGDYYFKDYYEWIEETLKVAAQVNDVNWILKPHPSRHNYNEKLQSIEDLFAKYKSKNMYILPDEISGESICSLADATITIGSNAAIEYACFGIPSILIGHPYFYGFGFTTEPKTREDYFDTLRNIADIRPMTDEQIRMAKGVFYIYVGNMNNVIFTDEFAKVANEKHKKMHTDMASSYFKGEDKTKDYNTAGLVDIIEYMKANNIKDVQYYTEAAL